MFSIFVELKTAPQEASAQFGGVWILGSVPIPVFDPATTAAAAATAAAVGAQTLKQTLAELARGIVVAFIVTFASTMMIKLMQKLESYHIIKDITAYSDALELDQYLGRQLNKWILKPKQKSDLKTNPEDTNAGSIAQKASQNPINGMSRKQIEELAEKTGNNFSIQSFVFVANPPRIAPRSISTLTWNIQLSGGLAIAKLRGVPEGDQDVTFSGSYRVDPDKTTDYFLQLLDPDTRQVIASKCVFVEVSGTSGNRCAGANDTGQTVNRGLTDAQEAELLRGGISLLTSAIACGGVDTKAVRNVAIYNAARSRGFDPRKINPSSGNFYTQMYKMGNPFSSPDFQELVMRDSAATLEAQAKQSVQTELTSNGLKSLRSEKNGISRTSQTIVEYISQTTNNALQSLVHSSGGGLAARAIGSTLAKILVQALLKQDGTVIPEYPYCGIAQLAADEIARPAIGNLDLDLNSGTVPDTSSYNPLAGAYIRVNGKDTVFAKPGDEVTLTWYAGLGNTRVYINNEVVPNTGSRKVIVGTEPQQDFRLLVDNEQLGAATVVGTVYIYVQTPGDQTDPTDPLSGQSLDFLTPSFRIRE